MHFCAKTCKHSFWEALRTWRSLAIESRNEDDIGCRFEKKRDMNKQLELENAHFLVYSFLVFDFEANARSHSLNGPMEACVSTPKTNERKETTRGCASDCSFKMSLMIQMKESVTANITMNVKSIVLSFVFSATWGVLDDVGGVSADP